ncbi:LANO_0E01310g1_1 [Lachancea nothofagi CBS 11611]|uniref:LANO_0E01310g1_1 n=1 Tax=Lachancea nothofagi CBS 11611 TaxID=1266666 RepID=A0A1G4JPQ7_9SACH|nr:LANO_0E01310g1_1 [Lachancea nothofagi CBS 11611]
MTTIPSPTDVGALANRINFHTRDQHNKIDGQMSVKFAFAMKHGFIYRQGILAYYYIFNAIEQEIDRIFEHAETPEELQTRDILKQFWVDDFRRSDKIFQDLELLYAKEYPCSASLKMFLAENVLPPEQQTFVNYIHEGIQAKPTAVLAYCHVLYLALFAGGRVMRSTVYRSTGLFPKFPDLTPQEVVRRGTNFFTFSPDGVLAENQLRKNYKKGYELATRQGLTEEQKLHILEVSNAVFEWNTRIVSEIGEINRQELMGKLSFKLISFAIDEWKHTEKLTRKQKSLMLAMGVVIQLLAMYWMLRKLF